MSAVVDAGSTPRSADTWRPNPRLARTLPTAARKGRIDHGEAGDMSAVGEESQDAGEGA